MYIYINEVNKCIYEINAKHEHESVAENKNTRYAYSVNDERHYR